MTSQANKPSEIPIALGLLTLGETDTETKTERDKPIDGHK